MQETSKLIADRERIEREKELAVLREQEKAYNDQLRIITIAAIIGLILIGLFTIIIYLRFRKERKLSYELDKKNQLIFEANVELESQKETIEKTHYELVEKNEEIMSSIRYAQRIQNAILPWQSTLSERIKDYCIIYKPKDIVSGDFYWFKGRMKVIFLQ